MFTLNCKGRLLVIDEPIVMGIINATPDSFYSGSRELSVDGALQKAQKMVEEGATILDIGGQSTRPGSSVLNADEELKRALPIIEAIHKRFPDTFLSIDTYYGKVARAATEHGASIVNDISGGSFDTAMLTTVADLQTPYVCMHNKGTVGRMHQNPVYEDVIREVLDYFIQRIEDCVKAGIRDIIINPGFGLSKDRKRVVEGKG